MKFSLLHPSRQRPHKSFRAMSEWVNSATGKDFELIVSIDENDPYKDQYINLYANLKEYAVKVIVNRNRSAVDAINNAAKASEGEILIVVSDDTDAVRGWNEVISQACGTHKDFVLKLHDGTQDWIVTMPILDRAYYNRYGYIYFPDYQHQFCDTEFTHVADITKRILWRNDIEIKHLHYSVIKEKRDELYARNDGTWNQGKDLYIKRAKQAFGLKNVNIWSIKNRSHLQWLTSALKA
jgi:hypothetical protein